jgi:hypothetical protein
MSTTLLIRALFLKKLLKRDRPDADRTPPFAARLSPQPASHDRVRRGPKNAMRILPQFLIGNYPITTMA